MRKINVFVANFFSLASLSCHIITCIGVAAPLSSIMSNNPPILFWSKNLDDVYSWILLMISSLCYCCLIVMLRILWHHHFKDIELQVLLITTISVVFSVFHGLFLLIEVIGFPLSLGEKITSVSDQIVCGQIIAFIMSSDVQVNQKWINLVFGSIIKWLNGLIRNLLIFGTVAPCQVAEGWRCSVSQILMGKWKHVWYDYLMFELDWSWDNIVLFLGMRLVIGRYWLKVMAIENAIEQIITTATCSVRLYSLLHKILSIMKIL